MSTQISLGDGYCVFIPDSLNSKVSISDLMLVKKLYWQTSPRDLKENFGGINPLDTKTEYYKSPLSDYGSYKVTVWQGMSFLSEEYSDDFLDQPIPTPHA
jgi:hypothetical protein